MNEELDRREPLDREALQDLLRVQDGVVSRRQIRKLNGTDSDIARMLRRRELSVVHPGVYVDHTGSLDWEQRAWAGVLAHWPAALTLWSALPNPGVTAPIHVAIDARRSVRSVAGVRAYRTVALDQRVRWNRSPPRVQIEHAVIDTAVRTNDSLERFQILASACQSRETTVAKIASVLNARRRVRDRAGLQEHLADLAAGACSVLEREYLDLERRHGLPVDDRRQRRDAVGAHTVYRDVDHRDFGVFVELDGKAFHDTPAARDQDFERDLDTVLASRTTTVRLTYGQVIRHGCRTIRKIATLLERGGWPGSFQPCPECPPELGA